MSIAKWIAPVVVVVGIVAVGAEPAAAGGSPWNVTADHYEVGDTAFAWAPIAWEHNPGLGTPEDGPYFAYLAPFDPLVPIAEVPPPVGAVQVGEVKVSMEPYGDGAIRFGPHHATIEFVVPELPDGVYTLGHCNSPCTTTLGDLWSALLTIGPTALPPPTAPATAPPPTVAAPPPPTVADAAPIAQPITPLEADTAPGASRWTTNLVAAFVGALAISAGIAVARLRARPRLR
jgi:hypothetical protein